MTNNDWQKLLISQILLEKGTTGSRLTTWTPVLSWNSPVNDYQNLAQEIRFWFRFLKTSFRSSPSPTELNEDWLNLAAIEIQKRFFLPYEKQNSKNFSYLKWEKFWFIDLYGPLHISDKSKLFISSCNIKRSF